MSDVDVLYNLQLKGMVAERVGSADSELRCAVGVREIGDYVFLQRLAKVNPVFAQIMLEHLRFEGKCRLVLSADAVAQMHVLSSERAGIEAVL